MPEISIAENIRTFCSSLRLGLIQMEVSISASNEKVKAFIHSRSDLLLQQLKHNTLKDRSAISAARNAYKNFGKDPSRYRLSAEALCRRVINGKSLYQVNNIVDLLNIISISSGCSIGGYDENNIHGHISLKLGSETENYQAIGRGTFNIHKLPVLYDEIGPFGNPSSDSERTKVTSNTNRFLMVFFDFGADPKLELWMNDFIEHSLKFEMAKGHQSKIIQ